MVHDLPTHSVMQHVTLGDGTPQFSLKEHTATPAVSLQAQVSQVSHSNRACWETNETRACQTESVAPCLQAEPDNITPFQVVSS